MLALAWVGSLAEPGLTWDEPEYCYSGVKYAEWISHLLDGDPRARTLEGIDASLRPNHEHPPLARAFYGEMIWLTGGCFGCLTPARTGAALLFTLLVLLTARVGRRLFGDTAGLCAGAALALMPGVLAHARLAALDLPMALAWMLAAWASLRSPPGWKGACIIGCLWGLGLLTKVNGIFLLAPLVLWGKREGGLSPRNLLLLLGVGLATFFLGWPWLWNHTAFRIQAYLLGNVDRWVVPTFYLGQTYAKGYPPWHYPLVMTVVTMPPAVLLCVLGGSRSCWRGNRKAALWLGLHLAFTLGLACLPGVPRYDGVRLFLPAFPFLAILAGLGADLLLRALPSLAWRIALVLLLVVPTALRFRELSPCLLSYFSPAVGGLKGAEGLGFEITFWGGALTPELLEPLQRLPKGSRVATAPMGEDYFAMLKIEGLVPLDSVWAMPKDADAVIYLRRKGMLSEGLRLSLRDAPVLSELRREGVVLAKVLAPHSPHSDNARPSTGGPGRP